MKTVSFITRLSRKNVNIEAIYNSIKLNFNDYYWLIYVEKNTIPIPLILKNIQKNDTNIIINNNLIRDDKKDIYFSKALDDGFNSKYAKESEWIYVLDDDNIIHKNLPLIINRCKEYDLIINKLIEEKKEEKRINVTNPQNLSVDHCINIVDWANGVFSSKFFQNNVKHIITNGRTSDGSTVKAYIEHNAKIYYSNEIAGYYNYLKQ